MSGIGRRLGAGIVLSGMTLVVPLWTWMAGATQHPRTTAPSCLSASVIKSVLRGALPSVSTGSGSSNGVTSSTCTYGSSVQIGYATPATTAAYNALLAQYKKGNPSTKSVSVVGDPTFSYDITNNFSTTCTNGKCTTTQNKNAKPTNYIDALVKNKAIVEVSGLTSSVSPSQVATIGQDAVKAL